MKHEFYKSIAYARFNISKKGILWTKIEDSFTPRMIDFFSDRFSEFYIIIEHKNKTYVKKGRSETKIFNASAESVVKRYETILSDNELMRDLEVNDELWNVFYESQYVKERKNIKLFNHWIPKYLKNVKTLSKEFLMINPCRKISDFLSKE